MLFFLGNSCQISSTSQCHSVRYCFWVFWLCIKCCPFISWMFIWSFCRNTFKYIFYNLSTFCLSSVKSSFYYSMFLISLIPFVSFGQTSVLSGLLQNLTWPFRKLSFVYRAQQLWGPCCFPSHWSHSVLSSCLSGAATKPATQFGDRGSKASYHIVHAFLFLPNLVLYPEEICYPHLWLSLPHLQNAEVYFHLAFCGAFCTGIVLTLSGLHSLQP